MKMGWKVLEGRRSAMPWVLGRFSGNHQEEGVKIYRVGKWVKPAPKCGPLAVFKTEHTAKEFLLYIGYYRRGHDLRVVPCEYKPSDETTLYSPARGEITFSLPCGTALAERVRCLS